MLFTNDQSSALEPTLAHISRLVTRMSSVDVIGGREVRRRRVKLSVKWSLLIKSTEYAP